VAQDFYRMGGRPMTPAAIALIEAAKRRTARQNETGKDKL